MLHNNSTHSLLFFLFFFMGGGGWGVLFLPIFSVYFLQACLVKQAPLLPYPPPSPPPPYPPTLPPPLPECLPLSILAVYLLEAEKKGKCLLMQMTPFRWVNTAYVCVEVLSPSLSLCQRTLWPCHLSVSFVHPSFPPPPPPTPHDLPFSRLNLALKKRVNALYSEWAVHLGLCAFSEQFCYWSLALAVFFCVAAYWLCMHLCAFSDKHLYQHLFTLSLCCRLFWVLFECLLCTISI